MQEILKDVYAIPLKHDFFPEIWHAPKMVYSTQMRHNPLPASSFTFANICIFLQIGWLGTIMTGPKLAQCQY